MPSLAKKTICCSLATTIERNKHHVWDLWHLRRQLPELKLDWEKDAPPEAPAVVRPIEVEMTQAK